MTCGASRRSLLASGADYCSRKLDVVVTREKCLSIFIPRHRDLVLKPFLGKNFGRVAWTPFVMHWSYYGTVLPGDMQMSI